MAKKQTRRSVSIRGSTYDQVRAYCERNGLSMSEFVEDRVAHFFDGGNRGQPVDVRPPVRPRVRSIATSGGKPLDQDELHTAARHFTF